MNLSDPAISNFSNDSIIHVERKREKERKKERKEERREGRKKKERARKEVLLIFLKPVDLCRQL